MYPESFPSPLSFLSTDTFTSASSPNTDRAYRLAAKKLEPTIVYRMKRRRSRREEAGYVFVSVYSCVSEGCDSVCACD